MTAGYDGGVMKPFRSIQRHEQKKMLLGWWYVVTPCLIKYMRTNPIAPNCVISMISPISFRNPIVTRWIDFNLMTHFIFINRTAQLMKMFENTSTNSLICMWLWRMQTINMQEKQQKKRAAEHTATTTITPTTATKLKHFTHLTVGTLFGIRIHRVIYLSSGDNYFTLILNSFASIFWHLTIITAIIFVVVVVCIDCSRRQLSSVYIC